MKFPILLKVVFGATALLLIPLGTMQFVDGFNWTGSDFAIAWILLIGIGVGLATALNRASSTTVRVVGGLTILVIVWLWAELAVGLFTTWGN